MRIILTQLSRSFIEKELDQLLASIGPVEFTGAFYYEYEKSPLLQKEKPGLKIWTYDELTDMGKYSRTPFHDHYERILSIILADSRTYFLAERLFSNNGQISLFNNVIKVEQIVWNSLAILYESRPDRIFSGTTPHDSMWFFTKVAELMGAEVYVTPFSPIYGKRWIVKGLDDQVPVVISPARGSENEKSHQKITNYIKKVRSSYEDAIPAYQKEYRDRYRGSYFRLSNELRFILTSPSPTAFFYRTYSTVMKKKVLDLYCRYTTDFAYPEKYIAFFLHYQPERTTLPEANQYSQQWLAIRALADSLPQGWKIVVREHPSTFHLKYSVQTRDTQLYDAIASLPNVLLAPMEITPFELLDRSMGIATMTGTVGIEAVIRGKPVLAFGAAQYRELKGVFTIKSARDIKSALTQIERGCIIPDDLELIEYFRWVDDNSIPLTEDYRSFIEAIKIIMT